MSTKSFRILKATRRARNGPSETLSFRPGVNVIVGEPNTGKTRWLEMIDFLLGDDGKAEEKLGEAVFTKYANVEVELQIGDEKIKAQRRWHEAGAKTKIFVNETAYTVGEFRQFLLDKIGIPSLHYPQGNPLGTRTWPELGWRSLFRHIYRRQRFWGEIADQQPLSEQHACILQFLGMAEKLYSKEYGELVGNQKEIIDLTARKEHFVATLNEVSREIVSENELDVAVTPEHIKQATDRLNAEVADFNKRRQGLINKAISKATAKNPIKDSISRMTEEFAAAKEEERKTAEELERVSSRIVDLGDFQSKVIAEISRLERAQKAGDVLANLKVTHCPVCDRQIKKTMTADGTECYLCHQPTAMNGDTSSEPFQRLEFELEQLKGEKKEIGELVESLTANREKYASSIQSLRNKTGRLTEQLNPVRVATAAIIPPEVALIDNEIGRRVERIDQLRRIRESLARREKVAAEILKIQKRVEDLTAQVSQQTAGLDFETASDALSDGMNEFVSALEFEGKKMWTQKEIQFSIKKDSFSVRVGRQKWASQLGGTMTIYFFLAYHYTLLKLTPHIQSRYPGFIMLDFPPEIEGEKVADHENFVLEPFVKLCKSRGYENCQIIAAGSAFKGLQGVHRQALKEVWT
ncbi:MAG: hypothetical protein ACKVP0_14615 [Pirellulaceae bacterium]